MVYSILVSAQGPLVLGLEIKGLGLELDKIAFSQKFQEQDALVARAHLHLRPVGSRKNSNGKNVFKRSPLLVWPN